MDETSSALSHGATYYACLIFFSLWMKPFFYHSNESYWAVLSCGAVYNVLQEGPNFWVCVQIPVVRPFKLLPFFGTFTWYHFLSLRFFFLIKKVF